MRRRQFVDATNWPVQRPNRPGCQITVCLYYCGLRPDCSRSHRPRRMAEKQPRDQVKPEKPRLPAAPREERRIERRGDSADWPMIEAGPIPCQRRAAAWIDRGRWRRLSHPQGLARALTLLASVHTRRETGDELVRAACVRPVLPGDRSVLLMALLESEGQQVHLRPDAPIDLRMSRRAHWTGREFGILNIATSIADERPWRARRGDAIFIARARDPGAAEAPPVSRASGEDRVKRLCAFGFILAATLCPVAAAAADIGRDGGRASPSPRHSGRFHPVRSDPDRGRRCSTITRSLSRCRGSRRSRSTSSRSRASSSARASRGSPCTCSTSG